jgi:hypothetical protein
LNDVGEIRNVFNIRANQIKFGPNEVGTVNNEGPRLKETRKIWNLRADDEPGAYFNKGMIMLHEGCQAGYCYPENGGEKPDKSSEYCHIQDALQAVIVVYNRMVKPQNQFKKKEYTRQKRHPGRWKIGIPNRPR